jgi:hypothetical protein
MSVGRPLGGVEKVYARVSYPHEPHVAMQAKSVPDARPTSLQLNLDYVPSPWVLDSLACLNGLFGILIFSILWSRVSKALYLPSDIINHPDGPSALMLK